MEIKVKKQQICKYCGRYYRPDPRVGEKQKACFRDKCKQKRKREAQEAWKKKNPLCLKNHYQDYVKGWRQREKEARVKSDNTKQRMISLEKLVLYIPGNKAEMIRDEISLKRVARHTYTAYG